MGLVAGVIANKTKIGRALPPDMIGRGLLPTNLRLPRIKYTEQEWPELHKTWNVMPQCHTKHSSPIVNFFRAKTLIESTSDGINGIAQSNHWEAPKEHLALSQTNFTRKLAE